MDSDDILAEYAEWIYLFRCSLVKGNEAFIWNVIPLFQPLFSGYKVKRELTDQFGKTLKIPIQLKWLEVVSNFEFALFTSNTEVIQKMWRGFDKKGMWREVNNHKNKNLIRGIQALSPERSERLLKLVLNCLYLYIVKRQLTDIEDVMNGYFDIINVALLESVLRQISVYDEITDWLYKFIEKKIQILSNKSSTDSDSTHSPGENALYSERGSISTDITYSPPKEPSSSPSPVQPCYSMMSGQFFTVTKNMNLLRVKPQEKFMKFF